MCQRPKRASFISTDCFQLEMQLCILSVNALNGLLSFLPWKASIFYLVIVSVNALNGLLSFLLASPILEEGQKLVMCQRPKRASFISTKEEGMTFEELEKGVNALNGLLSFLQCLYRV